VDDVPWHTLRHACGTADDLPELLVTAFGADEDAAVAAIDDIDAAVYHQGGEIRGAAPAVLPFVVALAADTGRGRQVRRDALALVFQLARDAAECDPAYVHPAWPSALSAQVPCLEGLLDDVDPLVRREAADVLACAVDDFERVLIALHDRWRLEADPVTRLTLLAAAADLLDRHPRAEAVYDTVRAGRQREGVPASAVRWLIDRERRGDEDERVVLLATGVLSPTPPEDVRLAFDAVDGLAREEAPLWAAARLHEPATRERVAGFAPTWLLDLFETRPDVRGELAGRMLGADAAHLRRAGTRGVSRLIAESRPAESAWAPVLARCLDDPDEAVRSRAALALAVCGPASAGPWADRLAVLAEGPPADATNHALFALARMGDPRVGGLLRARSRLAGFGLPTARARSGGWAFGPHLADVLRRSAALADGLVPPLRERLRTSGDAAERDAVVDALADWGPAAAPLAPELAEALDTSPYPLLALRALGAIGAAAAPHCAARCLEWARGREAPRGAAWAEALLVYRRVTGDDATALDLLAADPEPAFTPFDPRLRLIAELGPSAARFADAVRDHVRGTGPRPTALDALWRVTGDAGEVLRHVLDGDERWWNGGAGVDSLTAVGLLGRMGAGAREALPLLRERLGGTARARPRHFGWRDVLFDHAYTAALRTAVERIGSAEPPR
jgi:hypothetical protein